MVVVRRQRERPGVDHEARRHVRRGLGFEGLAAAKLRGAEGRRHGRAVDQIERLRVDRRLHVEHVLLTRRRGPEAGADAAPHGDRVRQGVAGRELPVRRVAEDVEVLEPQRAAERPPAVRIPQFQVAVDRRVGAAPGPGRVVGEPRETVGAGNETLRGVRSDLPRRQLPGADGEALVAPLGAPGHVNEFGNRVGHVEVQVEFGLPVDARIEVARARRTQRSVHGVEQQEVRFVRAETGAGVPGETALRGPPHPGNGRHVGHHAAEVRRESARSDLLEGEAVRVGEDLRQRVPIRPVVGDRHHGTTRRSVAHAVRRVERVADEQRAAAVQAEDVGAGVRVAVVETLRRRLVGVVGVPVDLCAVREQLAEVAEQLQVVLVLLVAPDLRRVGDVRVPGRDQRRRVGPLHAAAGRVGIAVLHAQVSEAVLPQRQSDVAGDRVRLTVARAVDAALHLQAAARPVVLEQEVHDARDRVGAVLRRGAVAQDLDLAQRGRRNGRDVRPLGAVGHAPEPDQDRRAVAALAVDENERVVVGQVAQAGRPHQRRGAADRMRGDVERGHQVAQQIVQRTGALAYDVLYRDGVDRDGGLGHRPRPRTAADHDQLVVELRDRLVFRARLFLGDAVGGGHAFSAGFLGRNGPGRRERDEQRDEQARHGRDDGTSTAPAG